MTPAAVSPKIPSLDASSLHAVDDLFFGGVFGPSAASTITRRSVVAVGGIADGQRARDGLGLLRIDLVLAVLHRVGDRRAAGGLRAEEFHRLWRHQAQRDQFLEGLVRSW